MFEPVFQVVRRWIKSKTSEIQPSSIRDKLPNTAVFDRAERCCSGIAPSARVECKLCKQLHRNIVLPQHFGKCETNIVNGTCGTASAISSY